MQSLGGLSGLSANGSLAVLIRSCSAVEDCIVSLKSSWFFVVAEGKGFLDFVLWHGTRVV